MQHGFYFDHGRCVKCHACEIACKSWNEVDVGPALARGGEDRERDVSRRPGDERVDGVHALRRRALPNRVPGHRHHQAGRRRDRRRRSREVHRLRVLHLGVPVQRSAALGAGREDGKVQLLPDPGTRAPAPSATCLRGDLSHRRDPLRIDGRARKARPRVRRGPTGIDAGVRSGTDGAGAPVVRTGGRRATDESVMRSAPEADGHNYLIRYWLPGTGSNRRPSD